MNAYLKVVVFDNKSDSENGSSGKAAENPDEEESSAAFLVRILQYLETPQYLRKALFPRHNSLRFVVSFTFEQGHGFGIYLHFMGVKLNVASRLRFAGCVATT